MSANDDGFFGISFEPTAFHSSVEEDPDGGLGGDVIDLEGKGDLFLKTWTGDSGFSGE